MNGTRHHRRVAGGPGIATDCVASPYDALKCRAALRLREHVAAIVCGGLGSQAANLARVLGAKQVVAAASAAGRTSGALALDPQRLDVVADRGWLAISFWASSA